MTDNEKRLLERAEKLRRRMIQAKSHLDYGQPEAAKLVLDSTLREDG